MGPWAFREVFHPSSGPGGYLSPTIYPLEVLLVVFAVPRQFGPLEGELVGRRLGALLQLGAPVVEALVLRFQRLPFPPDRCLGLLKRLMGVRQHPGEGKWHYFWLSVGSKPPPKNNNLLLLRSGRREGAGRAPMSPAAAECVLDGVTIVEAAVPVGVDGSPSTVAAPLDVGVAAGSPAGAWEPDGAVSPAAAGGGSPAPLPADASY